VLAVFLFALSCDVILAVCTARAGAAAQKIEARWMGARLEGLGGGRGWYGRRGRSSGRKSADVERYWRRTR
jgi:hypothetical protein